MPSGNTVAAFTGQNATLYSFPEKRYLINEPNHGWWENVKERLEYLNKLEKGWDGYQGVPVSFLNANFALGVLKTICIDNITPEPQIVPGISGDLQLEWHVGTSEIELHIVGPNNVDVWICNDDTGVDGLELHLTTNFADVARALNKMVETYLDTAANS